MPISVLKYLLFFFNFLLWICGGTLVGIGTWANIERNKYYYQDIKTIYDVLLDLSILLIIVGAVMFVLGYTGCVGAIRENTCLINIFYSIIILIILLEVTIAVLAFVFKDKMHNWVTSFLQEGMILRYQDDEDAVMDWFQENVKCCGINGHKDWNKNMYFNCTKDNPSGLRCGVPYSCCKNPDALTPGMPNILCGAGTLNDTSIMATRLKIHTIGCVDRLIYLGKSNLSIIGGVVIGFLIPQLLGIYCGQRLVVQIDNER